MKLHPLAALLLALAAAPAFAAGRAASPLPWIANDYTRAQAEARARHLPIFVEAWAPW